MTNEGDIRRYTAAELQERREREGSKSDLQRRRQMTSAEREDAVATDPDWNDIPREWHKSAVMIAPESPDLIPLLLDADVLDWFRASGPDYQDRISEVLRTYVEQKRRA